MFCRPIRLMVVVATVCSGCTGAEQTGDFSILVSNLGAGEIVAFDGSGEWLRTVVGEEELPEDAVYDRFAPSDVAMVDEGLLVSNFATGQLILLDPESGAFLREFSPGFGTTQSGDWAEVEEPCQMIVEDNHLLVLGNDSKNVLSWNAAGHLEMAFGGKGVMGAGHGFAMVGDDQMVVAISPMHPWSGLLQLWDVSTHRKIADFGPYGELLEGTDIIALDEETVLVADWFGKRLVAYDLTARRSIHLWHTEDLGLGRPISMEWSPTNELLILDDNGVASWRPWSNRVTRLVDGDTHGFHWARNLTVVPADAF